MSSNHSSSVFVPHVGVADRSRTAAVPTSA